MLTPEILFAAGYREHRVPQTSLASRFYQRKEADRYFIDVYEYAPIPQLRIGVGYEIEARLRIKGQEMSLRLLSVEDLDAAEDLLRMAWERLGCEVLDG